MSTAPVQQDWFDSNAPASAPSTANLPAAPSSAAGSGDWFAQNTPATAVQAPPMATISTVRQPTTMIGKLGQWAESVSDDLKYGTDITGIGAVLKAMGAHGIYAGNPQEVGEFMASLPLGLLKAAKGATEIAPSSIGGPEGRTWEGIKKIGGGILQAATMPASFVGPEETVLSKEGALADIASGAEKATNAVKEGASALVKKVTAPVREAAAQPELQEGIRSTAAAVTKEAEVAAPKNPSLYKTMAEAADNVLAKSKSQYATLDEATGGKVQRFTDRLQNIRQELDGLTGTEEDVAKEAKLLKAQKETEDAMQEAFTEAISNGVDPKLVESATANFKQAQALRDLDTAITRSTSGKPVGVGEVKGLPESVDPKKLAPRITALWKSGRLQQAIGEENTADLMDFVAAAAKTQNAAIRNKLILKIALPTLAGAGAVGHLASAALEK